jgi:hypothetical protein
MGGCDCAKGETIKYNMQRAGVKITYAILMQIVHVKKGFFVPIS